MRTAREIFDHVKQHLLTQNVRSTLGNGLCAYRGENGCKCAIGCLIPDEVYKPEIEGSSIRVLLDYKLLPEELHRELVPHESLLDRLQTVHDRREPSEWERSLYRIEMEENLLNGHF